MARPIKYKVDVKMLEKLASYGHTYAECSAFLEVPSTVLEKSYSVFYTKGRESLKQRLRMRQIQVADKGNVVMLIWLGKQYLGQKDKTELEHTGGVKIIKDTIKIG